MGKDRYETPLRASKTMKEWGVIDCKEQNNDNDESDSDEDGIEVQMG